MASTIEIPASIRKADIGPVHAMIGSVCRDECVIGGVEHGADTLQFLGFAGGLDIVTGLYRGVYCFKPVTFEDTKGSGHISIGALPRRDGIDVAENTESEVD